ncbi:MAG TPA: hypothetical protein VGA78_17635 [Gemmatimonadales bacterium]
MLAVCLVAPTAAAQRHEYFTFDPTLERWVNGAADPTGDLRRAVFDSPWQDGRRSVAIERLVERLASLRAAGADIRLVAYSADSARSGQLRDEGMAATLARAMADTTRIGVVLSGNLHNRLRAGTAISADYRPAAFEVAKRLGSARVRSLDMSYDAGTAWTCTGPRPADCAMRKVGARHPVPRWTIQLGDSLDSEGYHGRYGVGAVTAAGPAIHRGGS